MGYSMCKNTHRLGKVFKNRIIKNIVKMGNTQNLDSACFCVVFRFF